MNFLFIPLGYMIGLWVDVLSFDGGEARDWFQQTHERPLFGALLGAVLAWSYHNSQIKGLLKQCAIGLTSSMAVMTFVGAGVYTEVQTSWQLAEVKENNPELYDFYSNSSMYASLRAHHNMTALKYGIPLSAIVGLLFGMAVHVLQKLAATGPDVPNEGESVSTPTNPDLVLVGIMTTFAGILLVVFPQLLIRLFSAP